MREIFASKEKCGASPRPFLYRDFGVGWELDYFFWENIPTTLFVEDNIFTRIFG